MRFYVHYNFTDLGAGFRISNYDLHIGPSEDRVTNRECKRILNADQYLIQQEIRDFDNALDAHPNHSAFISNAKQKLTQINANIETAKVNLNQQLDIPSNYCCGIIKEYLPKATVKTYIPRSLYEIYEAQAAAENRSEVGGFNYNEYIPRISKHIPSASTLNMDILQDPLVTSPAIMEEEAPLIGQHQAHLE
jgi:hypothetical protein